MPTVIAGVVAIAMVAATRVDAADPPARIGASADAAVAPSHRTPQALYVTARQAHVVLQANSDLLLIDVRTPAEVLFSGIATAAARNIPYLMIEEGYAYDPPARRYKLTANADFPKSIAMLLEERRLASEATIILYCSVGERSAKAATLLAASGYSRVYTMVDGFDGDATGDGWKRSGLPWTYTMTQEQAYHSPTM